MEKSYFKEEQRFDQLWFRLIILSAWVPLIVIFGFGLYQQLVLKKPWGNHPISDLWLILSTLFVFLIMSGATWLVFSIRLITEVTDAGLMYRFPPLINRYKTLDRHSIASFETRQYNPVREYGGWGIRAGGGKRGIAYNVKGKFGLQLHLHNGKKILFGTQRPDALKMAMERMMNSGNS
ncbi:MAG: hypothetical protein FJY10_05340 [Bacteroidetes bacterium]|nr:hypothetical protein [Bacteroidota bacterium]